MDWTTDADDLQLVFCTVPDAQTAESIARAVVSDGLAACVNILPAVRSIYQWKGALCDDTELLLVVKTARTVSGRLSERIRGLHPYETPEVVAVPLSGGSTPYLAWVRGETRG